VQKGAANDGKDKEGPKDGKDAKGDAGEAKGGPGKGKDGGGQPPGGPQPPGGGPGGDGGGDPGKGGKKQPEPPKEPSAAAKRVLVQAQKGDWPACEQTLKVLERAAAEGGELKPLANVADGVTGNTPLMYAAMENKITILERMIELGCDVNGKNKVRERKVFSNSSSFSKHKSFPPT